MEAHDEVAVLPPEAQDALHDARVAGADDDLGLGEIGRAHVWTPVPNAHLVYRLLLEKKKTDRRYETEKNRQEQVTAARSRATSLPIRKSSNNKKNRRKK